MSPLSRRYTCVRVLFLVIAIAVIAGWSVCSRFSNTVSARRSVAGSNDLDAATKRADQSRTRLNDAYGKLPLSFEANEGQASDHVKFISHGGGFSLFLSSRDALLLTRKSAPSPNNISDSGLS